MKISYQSEPKLSPFEFKEILVASTLGDRRPIGDENIVKGMIENAALIITARHDGKLVGVARSISDHVYCTYLSDLAVDEKYQHQGIGKELIRQTKLAIPKGKLILLSAPAAVDYYPKIGMTKHDACFYISKAEEVR